MESTVPNDEWFVARWQEKQEAAGEMESYIIARRRPGPGDVVLARGTRSACDAALAAMDHAEWLRVDAGVSTRHGLLNPTSGYLSIFSGITVADLDAAPLLIEGETYPWQHRKP